MPNPPVLTVTAKYFTSLILLVFITACGASKKTSAIQLIDDPHSFSKPEISGVKHLELELKVDFDAQRIHGIARYDLHQGHGSELILDHLGLRIQEVFIESPGGLKAVNYSLDDPRPYMGSALRIPLEKETRRVHIHYSSGTDAVALQWVPSAQTHDKSGDFLFTQSQSVYARSWIPCPDGPGMRFTYRATVQVPKGMNAVMSARRVKQEPSEGLYQFEMEIPIPAYLLALAVGDFKFKAIGNRTGVYAESSILEQAAYEFEDLEKMLLAAEQLYGPYPWGRYDVLVLPPSFPFGGMENPRMTFVTPSVISGDRSLTSLLAHELAHSWSGNLVTNASWNDFWLNEGFTTYFESRIMEALYGKAYADMLSLLGIVLLRQTMEDLGWDSPLTRLKLDLKEMDPEEAMTDIAYEKGKLLLRYLEERLGRKTFDQILKRYFKTFEFHSNTSEGFIRFLDQQLKPDQKNILDTVRIWVYEPGLPDFRPGYDDAKFKQVDVRLERFLKSSQAADLMAENWTTHEWLYFLTRLPDDQDRRRCQLLDQAFKLSSGKNAEIQFAWLEYAIQNSYGKDLLPQIEHFLVYNGRRKFLMPIYKALIEHQLGTEAARIYQTAKAGYHPISDHSVEKLLEANNLLRKGS